MESTKECMNILLLMNAVFQLWQNVLLEWEKCNILDGFGDVPTRMPKPIGKFAFNCLANLKEIQLDKLVKRFIAKNITLRECPTKGGRPELKSMYKFTRLLKKKVVIQNEIMIHFGHPKPMAKIRSPTWMTNGTFLSNIN
jgi:hypothetical protein